MMASEGSDVTFYRSASKRRSSLKTVTFADEVYGKEEEKPEPDISAAEASLMRKLLRSQLLQSSFDVQIHRQNPNSPLYSVKSFEKLHLHPLLLKGVYDMGFNYPSKIQETALPVLLADPPQNLIAQSQNGTGKTAAFVLACLSRVNPELHYPQVLILSPTYELALQTGNVAKAMARHIPDISFCFAIRDEKRGSGTKLTEQIIIGTPGKTLDWGLKFKFWDMTRIKIFVLDEADVMISTQGHQDQSIRIRKTLSNNCQMLLFSATYSEEVMQFAELVVPDPVIIRLKREEESLENIKQYVIDISKKDVEWFDETNEMKKFKTLVDIYGIITIGQAIIFCRTRRTTMWLAEMMTQEGHAVGVLSGDLTIDQRVAVLNRFREGKEKVLITTNVCARGIDVEQVNIVVNFDIPTTLNGNADCETYLHRIGRSGRFGKIGFAINMISDEKSRQLIRDIEMHFNREIKEILANDIDETTFA